MGTGTRRRKQMNESVRMEHRGASVLPVIQFNHSSWRAMRPSHEAVEGLKARIVLRRLERVPAFATQECCVGHNKQSAGKIPFLRTFETSQVGICLTLPTFQSSKPVETAGLLRFHRRTPPLAQRTSLVSPFFTLPGSGGADAGPAWRGKPTKLIGEMP